MHTKIRDYNIPLSTSIQQQQQKNSKKDLNEMISEIVIQNIILSGHETVIKILDYKGNIKVLYNWNIINNPGHNSIKSEITNSKTKQTIGK